MKKKVVGYCANAGLILHRLRRTFKITLVFLVVLLAGMLAGKVASFFIDTSSLPHYKLYTNFIYGLLAIGLYGSVFTINIKELRDNKKIVICAITVGVALKSIIIGSILYIFTKNSIAFLLGIAVAQIDPLSVASLLRSKKSNLSERAKTILAAWSSFDDPMSVIMMIYILNRFLLFNHDVSLSWLLFIDFASNISFATIVFFILKSINSNFTFQYILLAVCFIISICNQLMLGIAIIGLFLRPPDKRLSLIVEIAQYLSIFLLGMILINGVSLSDGLIVAIAAVSAQIIVGFILTVDLPLQDRINLSIAQQNGITAIILSLLMESYFDGSVAIIAPAILFINIINYLLNSNYSRNKIIQSFL